MLSKLWSFAPVRYVAVALVALALGAAVGRYLTPPRVVEHVVTKTEVHTVEVVKTVTAAAKDRVVVRTIRVTSPGPGCPGPTTTETTERETEHTDESTHADAATATAATSSTSATRITEAPKSWGITARVGVGGIGGQSTPITAAVGAEVTGRVWGPVRAGAWGLYFPGTRTGAAGGSLGVDF